MALTTIQSTQGAIQGQVAEALRGRRGDAGSRTLGVLLVTGTLVLLIVLGALTGFGLFVLTGILVLLIVLGALIGFEVFLLTCLLVSLIVLGTLISTVLVDGVGVYTERGWSFLDSGLSRRTDSAGISQGLIGSFWIAMCVLLVALPLGIGAAIYLEEYARRNPLTSFIELNIRNLAGVPSVVYGLLGLGIFVNALNGFVGADGAERRTLLAAGITLAVLVLPIIIITTAEALRAVPASLREGAYGAGATRWEVIRTVVLPYAAPGIFTGALLSIARAVGEAAPLIVIGAVTGFRGGGAGLNPGNVFDPSALAERFTAMPAVITAWAKLPQEEFKVDNAAAAIIAMMVFVLLINSLAIVLRNRFERKRS